MVIHVGTEGGPLLVIDAGGRPVAWLPIDALDGSAQGWAWQKDPTHLNMVEP